VPVDRRDVADAVVEIRRCQIQDDGTFVLAGVVDPAERDRIRGGHHLLAELAQGE
jgi:hypothetical protein